MRTDSIARPVYAIRRDSNADRDSDVWMLCGAKAYNELQAVRAANLDGFKPAQTADGDYVTELAPGDDVGEPGYVWTVLVHK